MSGGRGTFIVCARSPLRIRLLLACRWGRITPSCRARHLARDDVPELPRLERLAIRIAPLGTPQIVWHVEPDPIRSTALVQRPGRSSREGQFLRSARRGKDEDRLDPGVASRVNPKQ